MHIFFSGVGGTGIGPLALIAHQAGYQVSGSDKQESQYIDYLRKHGVTNIHIGQTESALAEVHQKNPIDWYVYSSAVLKENPEHPELLFTKANHIKTTKRDEFLNHLLEEKSLKLIAVAGTHGKSTTTAMTIWLMQQLGIPLSYSVGAKISFGEMGHFDPASEYFVYECDEFDRNFLAFHPHTSLITGITWDHHEIFPTEENYQQAFKDFIAQSGRTFLWRFEAERLQYHNDSTHTILEDHAEELDKILLNGLVNRQNAWQVISAVHYLSGEPLERLFALMNEFPGLSRRMERLRENLYSDYAHTPEKIVGALGVALDIAKSKNQKLVAIYEPLTNRRMHYMRDQHRDIFKPVSALYWVPSYLAREDPAQHILTPSELIQSLDPEVQQKTKPMELNDELKQIIASHLAQNDMVVAFSGGGGHSLDEWLRAEFA